MGGVVVTNGEAGRGGTTGSAAGPGAVCAGPGGAAGGFLPAVHHPLHRGSVGVTVADLNADGRPDLVVSNAQGQDGAGGTDGIAIGVSGAGGDTFNETGSVSVLLSDGTAGYRPAQHYLAGEYVGSVAVSDLNGDGKSDLAVAGRADVHLLLNGGDGALLPPVAYVNPYSRAVVAGDLNGDGRSDFAAPNPSTSAINLFLNAGNGAFVATTIGRSDTTFRGVVSPNTMALADVDGNGQPDIVAGTSESVIVLYNTGGGTFDRRAVFGAGSYPLSVAIGDLNADGKPDMALAGPTGLSVMLNVGDGTLAAAVRYADDWFYSVAIGDLNGDGYPDLAGLVSSSCSIVGVVHNAGGGTFRAPKYVSAGAVATPNVGYRTTPLALADMNADGALDLVVPTLDGVAVLINAHP
jgi:hypothetical protein